jgi:imidazolonepropionase-like amidohydrolase
MGRLHPSDHDTNLRICPALPSNALCLLTRLLVNIVPKIDPALPWRHDLALERAFAAAGGLLVSGPDPTGAGDVLPGFGDQRGIELLAEDGFSPAEAIRIATLNGAIYLGRQKEIGSVTTGKNADLVVIKGDPSKQISDIENVEIIFKDGIGYDSNKLLNSVSRRYGQY